MPEQVDHLDGGNGCLGAFVAGLRPGPLDGLLDGIRRDDAEDDRHAGLQGRLGRSLGHFPGDKVVVGRRASDDGAQTDDGVVGTALGQLLRDEGRLERARSQLLRVFPGRLGGDAESDAELGRAL